MSEYKYIFGPVPSRRLGLSLGISPIIKKTCNYSCIYCQLGRTSGMSNERQYYFKIEDIVEEFKSVLNNGVEFDVVTIVGEGEPTLYLGLGRLLEEIKKCTDKPVAVITNGALLSKEEVREELKMADLVLPSLDAYDEESFRKINRPYGKIKFNAVYEGLRRFAEEYRGQLWLEMMLIKGLNDDEGSLYKLKKLLDKISYQRLFLNTPVRPPAESWASQPTEDDVEKAVGILGGIAINSLAAGGFYSSIKDDYEAVLSIIGRHPMNQHELRSFMELRQCPNLEEIFSRLEQDKNVEIISYKSYNTYRVKY